MPNHIPCVLTISGHSDTVAELVEFVKGPAALVGRSRCKGVTYARHAAMWAARLTVPEAALADIGAVLHRDHASVIHGCRKVEAHRQFLPEFKRDTDEFLAEVARG
jgi:chromosomal replication initiation ATPase DnaA